MSRVSFLYLVFLLSACSSVKKSATPGAINAAANAGKGNTRTVTVESLDADTYFLHTQSTDPSYGFEPENAIKVGGAKQQSGPRNERRFLNALLGPNGERTAYVRTGSCCAFKTPNGLIDNMALLDRYKLYWEGSKDTLVLYLNMYDKGDLLIPVGLTAKK
jgi:hypothetical protein